MAEVDMATLVLLVLAALGVCLHLLAIPDIARDAGLAADDMVKAEARVYATGLAMRLILRLSAKLSIVGIGILVLLRVNGLIGEPVGDAISILAIVAVALLDVDTLIDLAARKYLVLKSVE